MCQFHRCILLVALVAVMKPLLLHQLGSDKWDKAKQKAQKQVRDTALSYWISIQDEPQNKGLPAQITMKIISNFVVNSV